MSNTHEEYISPFWAGFRRLWWIVAIITFILLLLMWINGYGPGGKNCAAPTANKPLEAAAVAEPAKDPVIAPVASPVIDNTAPVLNINGATPVNLIAGDDFTDPGASATDDNDGELVVLTSGVVDSNTPGEYTLTYTATDKAGNTSSETRSIIVKAAPDSPDSEPPTITLNGSSIVRLTTGDRFTDPGASSMDNTDGKVSVTTSGSVDTNKAGEYTLTYIATDVAGNSSSETRTVIISEQANLPDARLYFDYDSDSNPDDRDQSLADVIAYLKTNRSAVATVSGYHDPTGNSDHNQDLAKRRAETVIGLLINMGIPINQIVMEKPVETTGSGNHEEARRVEIKLQP